MPCSDVWRIVTYRLAAKLNWINKPKQKSSRSDSSPELKRGEFKRLLLDKMETQLSDFEFLHYKNSTYHFGRTRDFKKYLVYEGLHLNFSLKERVISCSVSSNFNPTYRFISSYQGGILNNHFDLLTLKRGTRITPTEEAYYFHNGRVNTTNNVIEEIVDDILKVGLNFFDSRFNLLWSNELLSFGLQFIEKLSSPKDELKKEFETELRNAKHVTSRIKHPIYVELKERLQAIPNQTRELRQLISGLAYSLIEMYYEN